MRKALVVLEHEAHAGTSLMGRTLGLDARVVRPYLGEALPDPAECGGLVVLGGSMGAWDDAAAPWLPATRQLIRDVIRDATPILGICLGAQLLAAACGGTVERGAPGLELGAVPVTPLLPADADPFFGAVGRALAAEAADHAAAEAAPPGPPAWLVRQYHYDAVTRLPADADLMITGNPYPHQGFRVGAAAWGVQYHPEVSDDLFTQWVSGAVRSGELPADAAGVLGPVRAASAAQTLVARAHARAFRALVDLAEPDLATPDLAARDIGRADSAEAGRRLR